MTETLAGRLRWRPLRPFGAEVAFDFRQPMTDEEAKAFRALFYRESLILARGQELSPEQQAATFAAVGPVQPPTAGGFYLKPDGHLGNLEFSFHSDFSFLDHPMEAISLHAVDVVSGESHTRFASGTRAWRGLPSALKARIEGRRIHSAAILRPLGPEEPVPAYYPQTVRDIAWPHPETGEPILMVVEQHAVRILDMPRAESDALMGELASFIFAPDNIYRHDWETGDVVFWDNLALQHARPDLAHVTRRVLQRVCIATHECNEPMARLYQGLSDPEEIANFKATRDQGVRRWAPAEAARP